MPELPAVPALNHNHINGKAHNPQAQQQPQSTTSQQREQTPTTVITTNKRKTRHTTTYPNTHTRTLSTSTPTHWHWNSSNRQQTTLKQPASECRRKATSDQQYASNQLHFMHTPKCQHTQRMRSLSETCVLSAAAWQPHLGRPQFVCYCCCDPGCQLRQ